MNKLFVNNTRINVLPTLFNRSEITVVVIVPVIKTSSFIFSDRSLITEIYDPDTYVFVCVSTFSSNKDGHM